MNNDKKMIIFHDGDIDWRESIKLGVSLLVDNNIATNELADKIIESTLKFGPYFVLCEKVALAHTAIGPYNKKVGMSLVIFRKPIKFSNEKRHEVNLLFTLSTTDANSHMEVLKKFAELFNNQNLVNQIINEKEINKIYKVFEEVI